MLSWNLSKIKNFREVCYFPRASKTEEGPDWVRTSRGDYLRLKPVTRAIMLGLKQAGLRSIDVETLDEALYRLDALFDAGVAFWHSDTPEGPVPMRLGKRHLVLHLGLECAAVETISNTRFDAMVRQIRLDSQHPHTFPRQASPGSSSQDSGTEL